VDGWPRGLVGFYSVPALGAVRTRYLPVLSVQVLVSVLHSTSRYTYEMYQCFTAECSG